MKKISKNVLLVSSVGLAGSAFAVTNTHPVFAANNASKKTTVANDQAKVKSAQKSVDQTQSKLTQVQNELNTANKDLAQKETELANAKSTAEAANSKVAAPNKSNDEAQSALKQAQAATDSANSDYQNAVKDSTDKQKDLTDSQNKVTNLEKQLTDGEKNNNDIKQSVTEKNNKISDNQKTLSGLQQEKSESDAKLASAQSDLAEMKQKADSASQALQTAKKDLSSATSTNESLTLPQSYIDYVTGKSTDWDTAKKDLQDVVNNHTYPFTDGDENDTVYDDPAALSESDQKRLDFYVKSLIDSVKSQVGSTSKLTITDGSLEFAKRYTQEYQNSNYVFRKYNAIKSASSIMGLNEYAVTGYDIAANRQVTSRSISIINGYIYNSYEFGTTKMSEIAKAAFDLVTQELANPTDYNNIINNNGYFSVAVTTQDDKFYVCLLTIKPANVPSHFNTNEVVKPSQDELATAVQKSQADSDQANKDIESAQSTFDQAQAENQKLGQEISDLQKKISDGQSSVASLQKQLTDTAKLQSQIKETKDSLPAKQAALQAANEKVQTTQSKLNDCKTALAAAQKEAANTQSNLDKVKADASSAQQKLQTAQKAYDEAKKKQEKMTASVASLTRSWPMKRNN
jgi:SEC10/PgrA surface exclusion-like protein